MATSGSKRLLSIDLLRGYFLVVIIIDHLGRFPNGLEWLTGRGALWVTAAEGFFFVSGFILGLTSITKISNIGFGPIWRKLWRRSLWLYAITVVATLGFTLWAFLLGFSPKEGLTELHHWPTIIQQALTLQYTFGWHDFLPRYAAYLFAAPLAGYLLYRRMWWAVVWGSFLVWAYFGRFNFNAAWQIVFFLGLVIGFHYSDIKMWFATQSSVIQRRLKAATIVVAALSLTAAAVICLLPFLLYDYGNWTRPIFNHFASIETMHWLANSLRSINQDLAFLFSHARMGLGRVVLFLFWFSAAFIIIQRFDRQLKNLVGWLLLPLGRNSLLTYMVHAVVLFLVDIYLARQPGIRTAFIQTVTTIFIVWISVVVIRYAQQLFKQPRPQVRFTKEWMSKEISQIYEHWRSRLRSVIGIPLASHSPFINHLFSSIVALTAAILVIPAILLKGLQSLAN